MSNFSRLEKEEEDFILKTRRMFKMCCGLFNVKECM